MDDSLLISLIRDLTAKVDTQASALAILTDRRSDGVDADAKITIRLDSVKARVTSIEHKLIESKTRDKIIGSALLILGGVFGKLISIFT